MTTKEEIIARFKKQPEGVEMPDLSDPKQFQEFAEELSSRCRPRMEALERLMKRSFAASFARPFG